MLKTTRRALILAAACSLALAGCSKSEKGATAAVGDMTMGDANAPVKMIEYASATCPHCARFNNDVFPEFKKKYIDTGKVHYTFREMLTEPKSVAAAAFLMARCAGKDKYFPLVETLFQQQRTWAVQKPIEPLFGIARQAGFTQQSFDACLRDQKVLDGIEKVRSRASERFKVESTPTFFINGTMYRGVLSIEDMAKAIDPLLKS
jgi:protein-disulfide isomerase